jgi:dTDP-4-amino-4,6-dideoxygalactose transaminase
MATTPHDREGLTLLATDNGLLDLPLARPRVPDPGAVAVEVEKILSSGILTNGPTVRQLEEQLAERLRVRHCVAVSSCTAGLMLVVRASGLSGDVIVPSFSFVATAHAIAWNGLRPVFVDIDPRTFTLDPAMVVEAIGVRTSAILATHLYGTPCDVEGLSQIASAHGVKLFFDAAHAMGSEHRGVPCGGFGDAEVFSLSPTKVLVAAEGGIIATNDDLLAERCRQGRDYGNPGNYDCQLVGLNARMSEVHAAVALNSLSELDQHIARRNQLARIYRRVLDEIPGIGFPEVPAGDLSTFKDLTITIDPGAFGQDADQLASALSILGVETRRYYSPPIHRMRAYRSIGARSGSLEVTDRAAATCLSLPLWAEMDDRDPERVADAIRLIKAHASDGAVARRLHRLP